MVVFGLGHENLWDPKVSVELEARAGGWRAFGLETSRNFGSEKLSE